MILWNIVSHDPQKITTNTTFELDAFARTNSVTLNELINSMDKYKAQVVSLERQYEQHRIQMEDTHLQQIMERDEQHEVQVETLLKDYLENIEKLKTEHVEKRTTFQQQGNRVKLLEENMHSL